MRLGQYCLGPYYEGKEYGIEGYTHVALFCFLDPHFYLLPQISRTPNLTSGDSSFQDNWNSRELCSAVTTYHILPWMLSAVYGGFHSSMCRTFSTLAPLHGSIKRTLDSNACDKTHPSPSETLEKSETQTARTFTRIFTCIFQNSYDQNFYLELNSAFLLKKKQIASLFPSMLLVHKGCVLPPVTTH